MKREFWNANTHYHDLVLATLPPGTSRVLDVGCGDGILSADIAASGIPHVVGLDVDLPVLDRARMRHKDRGDIEWVHGDVHDIGFAPESFDAVVSIAALHHMDAAAALARFAQLVCPGGVVVVIGLAASSWQDMPLDALGLATRQVLGFVFRAGRGQWVHSAPQCWPPPFTYGEMKRLSARILPGVRYRRHLLGRYSLVWQKRRN